MTPVKSNFLKLLDAGFTKASIPSGSTLVVAFSGGPDSSALLAGLAQLRSKHHLNLVAAHVNHNIRPTSSINDQTAAQRIAESLGVEFVTANVDVPELAKQNKISIESAARSSRYRALADIAAQYGAHAVVTGHTRDDQAETVLLHASRGSGLKGIAGMRYSSTLKIPAEEVRLRVVRPMLDLPGADCIAFCAALNIDPVIDESNASRDYTRNKIRLDVLPALNEAVPEASLALSRLASNAASDLEIIDWVVDHHLVDADEGSGKYSRSVVKNLPDSLVSRILMKAYELRVGHALDLERRHVANMLQLVHGKSGTSIELPNGIVFYIDKETFGFRHTDDDDCPYPTLIAHSSIALPGMIELGEGITLKADIVDRPERLELEDAHVTFATPDLLSHSLKLRTRLNGDRFQPLGMSPQVKLQDFFVGAGVPERWRDRVPIIDSTEGIVWIAGYRLAEWAKVLPEHRKVTRLELAGVKA
ncbi:tRNA lysidine(34) synthetase TilS [Dehalococcoides mccartyi]|nr:tRNA lysidine(34) synthetase TilS [Dehalococcoides mccartyi]